MTFRVTRAQAIRDHDREVVRQRNAAHSTAYIERAAKERAASRSAQESTASIKKTSARGS